MHTRGTISVEAGERLPEELFIAEQGRKVYSEELREEPRRHTGTQCAAPVAAGHRTRSALMRNADRDGPAAELRLLKPAQNPSTHAKESFTADLTLLGPHPIYM